MIPRQIARQLRRRLRDEERRHVLVHSLSGFGFRAAGVLLMTVVTMLFTRVMGAEEYGRVAFLLSGSFIVLLLVGLGLPTASLRLIPRYAERGRSDTVVHFLLAGTVFTVAAALGGSGLWLALQAVPGLADAYGFGLPSVAGLVVSVALMRFASEASRAFGWQALGFAAERRWCSGSGPKAWWRSR